MAGTLTASIIKNDTTSPPAFQNSAGTEIGTLCRAWVRFAGSTASINGSFNVSSITRSSAGFYQVNFTNAMPNTNYTAVANCSAQNASQFITFIQMFEPSFQAATAPTTTSFSFGTHLSNGSGADPTFVTAVVFA